MNEFLLGIAAFFVGLVVKDYFPGYVRKKGENVATKEDIAAITTEVESVKATIERQSQLLSAKQELLMKFYDGITTHYFEMLTVNFGDFPTDEGKSLFEYQQAFNKLVVEITKAYQRLVIFLPSNSKLLNIAEEITKCALTTSEIMKLRFGKVKFTFIDEHQARLLNDPAELQIAANAADDANREFLAEMRPHVKDFQAQYQEFLCKMNSYVTSNS